MLTCDPSNASERELLDLAYHAGACVELVSKSVLARSHPFLLREQKEWVMNGKALASTVAEWRNERTLNAGHALSAACTILGVRLRASAAEILKDRNAAAHLGFPPADPAGLIEKVALWLFELQSLEVTLGEQITSELANSVTHRHAWTAARLASAKKSFIEEPSAERRAWAADPSVHSDGERPVRCPACEHTATEFTFVDVEVEYAGPGEYTTSPIFDLLLRCPYCGLELNDFDLRSLPDELEALDTTSASAG
ncbi:hypothetical protein DOE76_02270 [Leifsonia sp. ku-ls]|nr:hypothetical protein DOE76_02270 [Leifsonia sp. ku-ls]